MLSPSFQPIWHCTAEVDVIDGGVAAICVQVDAADRLGLEITDKIFVQESSDFGVVVTAVQVVKPDGSIVIIPAVAEGVSRHDPACGLIQQIPPRVATLLTNERAGCTFMILQNECLVNPPKTAKGAWNDPCSSYENLKFHLRGVSTVIVPKKLTT